MRFLETKVPPLGVMIAVGLLMYLCSKVFGGSTLDSSVGIMLGFVFTLCGAALMLLVSLEFIKHKTTVDPIHPGKASSLVTSGIFRFSRNPMYLAMMLFLIAFALFIRSPWTLILTPIFVVYINRYQIQPEEKAMLAIFGKEYQRYREHVRRWL